MNIVDIKDYIGVAITGILGLLWFDIRNIRKGRDEHKKAINKTLETYLTKDKHEDLCKITILETMNIVATKIDESKEEILEAIKNNH